MFDDATASDSEEEWHRLHGLPTNYLAHKKDKECPGNATNAPSAQFQQDLQWINANGRLVSYVKTDIRHLQQSTFLMQTVFGVPPSPHAFAASQ